MNIFVSSKCPTASAEALDDKRVVKMILESCQMLNTVLVTQFGDEYSMGYKTTHRNHPCTLWTGKSYSNYVWLCLHMEALCNEYTFRYQKVHACEKYIPHFVDVARKLKAKFKESLLTPFVNCTSDFKCVADIHIAYRNQLHSKWRNDKRRPTWNGKSDIRF